jgi:hypothetical protein
VPKVGHDILIVPDEKVDDPGYVPPDAITMLVPPPAQAVIEEGAIESGVGA